MASLGLSKVFILDKYFTELQKFWETEKKLQDASSTPEAVHLQQRLKSLSSELVTLRKRLDQPPNLNVPPNIICMNNNQKNNNSNHDATIHKNNQLNHSISNNLNNNNNNSHHQNHQNNNHTNNNNKNSHIINSSGPDNNNSSKHEYMNSNANLEFIDALNNLTPTLKSTHRDKLAKNLKSINSDVNKLINNANNLNDETVVLNSNNNNHNLSNGTQFKQHKPLATTTPYIHQSSGVNHQKQNGCNDTYECMELQSPVTPFIQSSEEAFSIEDFIHLPGPLTEDAVVRVLNTRFKENKHFTNIGPILLALNPYTDVGNPLTLSSTRNVPLAPQLEQVVQDAVRQQAETGYPQAIILSGSSGSGKTQCSMLLLRQLFAIAGGGQETDAFKHLAAAFTVLRSLGSAKTTENSESSRIGQFIEVQVTDMALYRTKIHCYFLDQTRVTRPLPNEKNYHIFYQMMAGLNQDERARLHLTGYTLKSFNYLKDGDTCCDTKEDAARFQAWKTCLGILGIPFLDVVRVLAAILILGNVKFVDGQEGEVEVEGETELNSVATLLGVSATALFHGLTTKTHNARGQLIKSICDANMSNMTRDSLAKALYCRTVATIVRRANSLKSRLGSTLGTLSSDSDKSNESVHNQLEIASQHASVLSGKAGSKSMTALNNLVKHATTDGFIGILDMFGFEEPRPAQLEHLCINLTAETMQHFYNTHIFKSSVESCRDEGIICDAEVDYVDNVPCIDLISSLRTGLLSMLDAECVTRGNAETYVAKIKVQHKNAERLEHNSDDTFNPRSFVIHHFAARIEYDATHFLDTNRDIISDDLVSVFYKHTCNFGFATHLFGTELKALYTQELVPRGLSFRIAPTSHTDLLNGSEPISTLTQDFHTRLDNLLRTLVHARPHFVRCIKCNSQETANKFDRSTIVKQVRALQVLETVNLMSNGFPHRMRFKQFVSRYRMLAPFRMLKRCEEKALDDCKLILDFSVEIPPDHDCPLAWAPGKRHIFLSEAIRQHLEKLRTETRIRSATLIQATCRGFLLRKRFNIRRNRPAFLSTNTLAKRNNVNRQSYPFHNNTAPPTRPRPQPITGTPPPIENEKMDAKVIQQTCTLFGLDLERPPPVPKSRSYTVAGNTKLGYPQIRAMKMNFPENPEQGGEQLLKGEKVTVTGASHRRGHLIVEHKGFQFHVPFQYMELLSTTNGSNIITDQFGSTGNI